MITQIFFYYFVLTFFLNFLYESYQYKWEVKKNFAVIITLSLGGFIFIPYHLYNLWKTKNQ